MYMQCGGLDTKENRHFSFMKIKNLKKGDHIKVEVIDSDKISQRIGPENPSDVKKYRLKQLKELAKELGYSIKKI